MGAGLTPGDAISVDPSGIPVGETDEPVVMPSGDVAPIAGVGLAIPVTWARAGLQMMSPGRIARAYKTVARVLCLTTVLADLGLSDIGQSMACGAQSFGKISNRRCSTFYPAPRPASLLLRQTSKASSARLYSRENED